METLTDREKDILAYIAKIVNEKGYSPSVRDIKAALSIRSTSTVHTCLDRLEKKGYIQTLSDETDKRKQRIVLTEKTRTFCESHDEESEKIVHGIFAGIDPQEIAITIKTIMQMEKNLEDFV